MFAPSVTVMTAKIAHQADLISRALLKGQPVNAVTAGADLGIWRLSSIIHRLRLLGWPILADRDHHNGLAHYRLPTGWKPHADNPAS